MAARRSTRKRKTHRVSADKLTRRNRGTLAWVIENWPYPYRGSPKGDMDDLIALGLVRPYTDDEWGGPTALGRQVWKHAKLEWIKENDLGAALHDGYRTVRADSRSTTYEEAKRVVAAAEAESKAAGDVLDTFPKLANGLTPDAVKFSPEYKVAKARYNAAFAHLRRVNEWFVKNFNKEIRAERASRGR